MPRRSSKAAEKQSAPSPERPVGDTGDGQQLPLPILEPIPTRAYDALNHDPRETVDLYRKDVERMFIGVNYLHNEQAKDRNTFRDLMKRMDELESDLRTHIGLVEDLHNQIEDLKHRIFGHPQS